MLSPVLAESPLGLDTTRKVLSLPFVSPAPSKRGVRKKTRNRRLRRHRSAEDGFRGWSASRESGRPHGIGRL